MAAQALAAKSGSITATSVPSPTPQPAPESKPDSPAAAPAVAPALPAAPTAQQAVTQAPIQPATPQVVAPVTAPATPWYVQDELGKLKIELALSRYPLKPNDERVQGIHSVQLPLVYEVHEIQIRSEIGAGLAIRRLTEQLKKEQPKLSNLSVWFADVPKILRQGLMFRKEPSFADAGYAGLELVQHGISPSVLYGGMQKVQAAIVRLTSKRSGAPALISNEDMQLYVKGQAMSEQAGKKAEDITRILTDSVRTYISENQGRYSPIRHRGENLERLVKAVTNWSLALYEAGVSLPA